MTLIITISGTCSVFCLYFACGDQHHLHHFILRVVLELVGNTKRCLPCLLALDIKIGMRCANLIHLCGYSYYILSRSYPPSLQPSSATSDDCFLLSSGDAVDEADLSLGVGAQHTRDFADRLRRRLVRTRRHRGDI